MGRQDPFAWLDDDDDPNVRKHLDAESERTVLRTAHQRDLREQVFREIVDRTVESDFEAPFRKGGWWYYRRTVEGSQYPIMCRSKAVDGLGETVLLDCNEVAADSGYLALGTFDLSPDGGRLAYSTDLTGDERFVLRFKDLATGEELGDRIEGVGYGSAWSADAAVVYYVTTDESWRPDKVRRHILGTPAEADVTVFEEPDERFSVEVRLFRSERLVEIRSASQTASESWLLRADEAEAKPWLVAPRREGTRYSLEHVRGDADDGTLLILHSPGGGSVFELATARVAAPGAWNRWFPLRDGVQLTGVHAFAAHIVVEYRRDGRTAMAVHRVRDGIPEPVGTEIRFDQPAHVISAGANPDYDAGDFRFCHTSLTTPAAFYDHVFETGENRLVRSFPVLGYRPELYAQHRLWADAADGTRIPISVVARTDVRLDGSAPAVLEGYGAYGEPSEPFFNADRLSLLDRGFVYAIAHVRGGGEFGQAWHAAGRLAAKGNSFTDFVACAARLVAEDPEGRRWTSADRLVAWGNSAGGLLVGAAANLAPSAFRGVVAEMPFVDVLGALLDPAAPLTVTEWEEWGDPVKSAEDYENIRSYSPYENLRPVRYPDILAGTGLNDVRVRSSAAAKWIARLRATATGGEFLLKVSAEAGHGGASGRYDVWRERAFLLAWVIDTAMPAGTLAVSGVRRGR